MKIARNAFLARFDWAPLVAAVAVSALFLVFGMLVALVLSSCTGPQRTVMTGAFSSCVQADLGELVAPGKTLLADVGGLIKGNAPTLEADLDGLAKVVTVDAVLCAIVAVEAVLLAPAPSSAGSGSGEGSATAATVATIAAPPPGLARARAWAARVAVRK